MEQPFIIDAERVKTIRNKLSNPVTIQGAVGDIKRMLEIKQSLLWRADAGTCCGNLCKINTSLAHEVTLLENALSTVANNNIAKAVRILKDYEQLLESGT